MPESIEKLPFDSALFGFPVARIQLGSYAPESLEAALEGLRRGKIRLAYWTLPELPENEKRKVEALGGTLADRKLTFETKPSSPLAANPRIPVADFDGIAPDAALYALALESGAYSRFRLDPKIPTGCFESMYRAWIENSVSRKIAERVFVTREAGELTGLLTVGRKNGLGDIGLVAVSTGQRGKGTGSALVQRARQWFHEQGLARARVVTQGDNTAACRLYEKNNFYLYSAEHTYHFWL